MTKRDLAMLALQALRSGRLRLALMLVATATGVAAVVLLTALGDGARRYVVAQFSDLGSHLVIVLPGRSETTGGPPPLLGVTPRDLTLDDALALARSPAIARVAPVTIGALETAWRGKHRETTVIGTTGQMAQVRNLALGEGKFLPQGDPHAAKAVCVLGDELRQHLFGNEPALGEWVRIGDRRFRVIGLLAARGKAFDLDWNDTVLIPIASAQQIFNTESVFRVIASARANALLPQAKKDIIAIIKARHEGEDDITVLTQDSLLQTFDRILAALTYALAGIATVSLLVAGILIMNVMLIAVSQRTAEIGLMMALGARRRDILRIFLAEALLLSATGALVGALLGQIASLAVRHLYPVLPAWPPVWALAGAVVVALLAGVVFGLLPARRASHLDPVSALQHGA